MKNDELRKFSVSGFTDSKDLSKIEILEKNHNEAKDRFKLAKKEVKEAKKKLNMGLVEILTKIENKKKEVTKTQNDLVDGSESSSIINVENIKSKYEETMAEVELRKNQMKKKIEEYNEEGTEKWDSFKHKLNHDLEELGTALKGFVKKAK